VRNFGQSPVAIGGVGGWIQENLVTFRHLAHRDGAGRKREAVHASPGRCCRYIAQELAPASFNGPADYFMENVMKKTVSIAMLIVAVAAPALACEKPDTIPTIPDGKTAAMEEMMAAKKAVDAYKKGIEEYMACEKSNAKLDRAQADLVKVADRFNAQVKAFKAKS
jgi:hypothetical protein